MAKASVNILPKETPIALLQAIDEGGRFHKLSLSKGELGFSLGKKAAYVVTAVEIFCPDHAKHKNMSSHVGKPVKTNYAFGDPKTIAISSPQNDGCYDLVSDRFEGLME